MTKPNKDEPEETAPPEEITGLASATDENLTALFDDKSAKHLADGLHGGSDDDPAGD